MLSLKSSFFVSVLHFDPSGATDRYRKRERAGEREREREKVTEIERLRRREKERYYLSRGRERVKDMRIESVVYI